MATKSAPVEPSFTNFKPPRGWIRWTGVILALLGWWLSLDLVLVASQKTATNPWLEAQCGAISETGETFDCQSVLASHWASVPISTNPNAPRIPVAVLGMGYFAFLGFWYLFVGSPTRSRWARHLLITLIIALGAWESLYMIHVMANVLHTWCAGCLAVHTVNACLLLLTVIAFPWTRDPAAVAPHPRGRLALATLAACAFVFLLHPALALVIVANTSAQSVFREYNKIVGDPDYVRWQYERQPVQSIPADPDRSYIGDPDAPNTVIAFIDVQCVPCMQACTILNDLSRDHPGAIRVDYRHFPLDRACNDASPRSGYPGSCKGAVALEAARAVGGAEGLLKMHALLYLHRNELLNAPFAEYAADAGLDAATFAAAFESEAISRRVDADVERGKQLGVKATPVLFLNGRRLDHWSKRETWETLLGLEPAAMTDTPAPPTAAPTTP